MFDAILKNSKLPNYFTLYLEPTYWIYVIFPYLFGIAGIVLLINIITSGFKMMTSVGDPKVLQAAQAKLTTSLIGILIIFVAFWVVNLIMKFFGIELLSAPKVMKY